MTRDRRAIPTNAGASPMPGVLGGGHPPTAASGSAHAHGVRQLAAQFGGGSPPWSGGVPVAVAVSGTAAAVQSAADRCWEMAEAKRRVQVG